MSIDLNEKGAWRRMNMANTFRVSPVDVCKRDTVERVSALNLTTKRFIERYEKTYKPVVITDLQTDWPAREKWTLPVNVILLSSIVLIYPSFTYWRNNRLSKLQLRNLINYHSH